MRGMAAFARRITLGLLVLRTYPIRVGMTHSLAAAFALCHRSKRNPHRSRLPLFPFGAITIAPYPGCASLLIHLT